MKSSIRVPAALHSELTEYSSLLRALRTTQTLDLAGHLTRRHSDHSLVYEDDDVRGNKNDPRNDSDGEEEKSQLDTRSASSPPPTSDYDLLSIVSQPENQHATFESRSKCVSKGKKRALPSTKDSDLWTRWPLLSGDVHTPEWTLGDEVRLIASRIIRSGQTDGHEDDEDALLSVEFVDSLSFDASQHLIRILAACARMAPSVPSKSLAGRLHPIGWQGVLDSVSACGFVSPSVLERVNNRMAGVYGVTRMYSEVRKTAHERAALLLSTKRKRDECCASAFSLNSLLQFEGPPTHRKWNRSGKRHKQDEQGDREDTSSERERSNEEEHIAGSWSS